MVFSVYGHISGVLSTGSSDQMVALNGTRSVFVGDYRSSLMITTAIAILAVCMPCVMSYVYLACQLVSYRVMCDVFHVCHVSSVSLLIWHVCHAHCHVMSCYISC